MFRVYAGAILIIGGIAAFIEAHRHIPSPGRHPEFGIVTPPSGLSTTAYDLLRLGGWALVIFGAVSVILALIRYAALYGAEQPFASADMSSNGDSRPTRPGTAARPTGRGAVAATQPWDGGSHGEAVEPNPPR